MANDRETQALQALIQDSYESEDVFTHLEKGANPDVKDASGNTLLHQLVAHNAQGKFNDKIKTLIEVYKADLNALNSFGQTALQTQIRFDWFYIVRAMHLLSLGADPEQRNDLGYTLRQILEHKDLPFFNREYCAFNLSKAEIYLQELKTYEENKLPLKRQQSVNASFFLSFLFSLTHITTDSPIKKLPAPILLHIISFLDFKEMGKVKEDSIALACTVLNNPQTIKDLAGKNSGVNVYSQLKIPSEGKGSQYHFEHTFFPSFKRMCVNYQGLQNQCQELQKKKEDIDYRKMKSEWEALQDGTKNDLQKEELEVNKEIQTVNKRIEKMRTDAKSVYATHHGLYKLASSRQELISSVKESELFQKYLK